MRKPRKDQWDGCYSESWGGDIVPTAFAHPAKASKALIFRIVEHCFKQGWLNEGDTVIDVFGGIGTTALPCLLKGVNVVTCELEKKFCDLQEQNAALWQQRYGSWPPFSRAQWIRLCGDSRKLSGLLSAEACVSSPPYSNQTVHDGNTIKRTGFKQPGRTGKTSQALTMDEYGRTEGQLGGMPEGSVDAAVSSPPYAGGCQHTGGDDQKGMPDGSGEYHGVGIHACVSSPPYAAIAAGAGGLNTKPAKKPGQQSGRKAAAASQDTDQKYGQTDGQLAAMPDKGFDASIASPPFAQVLGSIGAKKWKDPEAAAAKMVANDKGNRKRHARSKEAMVRQMQGHNEHVYGETAGQLGAMPDKGLDAALRNLDTATNRNTICTCPPAKIVESKSAEEAAGVSHAVVPTSQRASQEGQNQKGTGRKSQGQDSISQTRNVGEKVIPSGTAAMTDGEAMLGESSAGPRLNEMDTSASSASQPTCSKSITKKTKRKQEGNGITTSETSKPCAYPATARPQDDTLSARLNAQCAESSSCTPDQELQPVHQNAGANQNSEHSDVTTPSVSTFWEAARQIVEQVYLLLKPGGVACWITKAYVKKGKIVDFNANWQKLCESVGFKTICIHHAMLTEELGTQGNLDGTFLTEIRKRASFFRRLAEKRGSPPINFEQVTCMVKPK